MAVFTKELHYVPDTPPDRGSRVTNPCVFYIMPELFLWWLSSCNKTKFHFIYFLWCTQLHSENNYNSIINLKNIVQTKQFLQDLHTKEEFCEMICEGLQHIASIVALIVSNLTRVSRSLWIDQGRCIDDLSHPIAANLQENLVKINPEITVLPVLTPGSGILMAMSALNLIVETTKSGETLSSCLVNHARPGSLNKTRDLLNTNCQIRSARELRLWWLMDVFLPRTSLGERRPRLKRRMIAVNYIYHQQTCL